MKLDGTPRARSRKEMLDYIVGRRVPNFECLIELAAQLDAAQARALGPASENEPQELAGANEEDDPLDEEEQLELAHGQKLKADLDKLPDPELAAIYRAELQKASEATNLRRPGSRTLATTGRYHHDDARAALRHWTELAVWRPHEAAALFLDKDPRKVNPRTLKRKRSSPEFRDSYVRLLRRLSRAVEAGHLGDEPGSPGAYLSWAKSYQVPYPKKLEDALLARGYKVQNWKELYEDARRELAELRATREGADDKRELSKSHLILHALAFRKPGEVTDVELKNAIDNVLDVFAKYDTIDVPVRGTIKSHLEAATAQYAKLSKSKRKEVERLMGSVDSRK